MQEGSLTHTVSSLPFQTLAIGEGDDVGIGVHAALGAATPHAFIRLAGAVLTGRMQRAGCLTRTCIPALCGNKTGLVSQLIM